MVSRPIGSPGGVEKLAAGRPRWFACLARPDQGTDDRLGAQHQWPLLHWLTEQGCTHVAMEATGVYWKPVWNIATAISNWFWRMPLTS
jgi:hypothetical protein